jgi:hypothetical protein
MLYVFSSDDLIHNRFDLIYDDVEELSYEYGREKYIISVYKLGDYAKINVWGKTFPQTIFDKCIKDVFLMWSEVLYIEVIRAGNNYNGWLYKSNNIYIPLPATKEILMNRLSKKHRYNLKRELRLLEQAVGEIGVEIVSSMMIDNKIINQYFMWKKITHNCEYNLSPREYIDTYHITDVMLLNSSFGVLGIILFCRVNDTIYLENFSYDSRLKKFSIGSLQYVLFLEQIIKMGCTKCFLGGGDLEYKKYFGAINELTYSGKIYSNRYIARINQWFDDMGIHNIAVYGMGAVGKAFLAFSEFLNIKVKYGIDAIKKESRFIKILLPHDNWPSVDAVIITMKSHDVVLKQIIKDKCKRVYFWDEIDKIVSS